MFVYLSKKIAVPDNTILKCIDWNQDQHYLAIGGDNGLLKVLKLEQSKNEKGNSKSFLSNLSMNKTLEGHKSTVTVVTWNEPQQKLTSADQDGVIIVWILYKGSWYEEMTNNRKKSKVNGMSWTSNGLKICIVYEDGGIIVGSVDGNRIWGKDVKNICFTGIQWSPDNKRILLSVSNGECHVYDHQGVFVIKVKIHCMNLERNRNMRISKLLWGNFGSFDRPCLAICYENGKIQLMCNENDDNPIVLDVEAQIVDASWNRNGTVLAIACIKNDKQEKESNKVFFFSPYGENLKTLKVPGYQLSSIAWERQSRRLAIATDSFIYFANIRPNYIWCCFDNTIVFFTNKNSFIFWNILSNQTFVREIQKPISLTANEEFCVIGAECTNVVSNDINFVLDKRSHTKKYYISIYNTIGTNIDTKFTDLKPEYIAINSSSIVVATGCIFMLWYYQTPKISMTHLAKSKRHKKFHIDDSTSDAINILKEFENTEFNNTTNDPITCIAISEEILLIARKSGALYKYRLPNVTLINRYEIKTTIHIMSINCNSTVLAYIDTLGIFKQINISDNTANDANLNFVERKEVWSITWALDNPQLIAIMEKTRMYVLRGTDPEEPVLCTGYLCCFKDLEIKCVLLDDIMNAPQNINNEEHIIKLRCKSLRDTEELLAHVGINETKKFIEDNPHPRLWKILAEAALKSLDLVSAETAFVRSQNFPGILFIRQLKSIHGEYLKKAEIASFCGNFDSAEDFYIKADRRDLAINLRKILCDWFRVVQLYRMGPGISDQQLESAWKEIGDQFAYTCNWEGAKEYYEKAHYTEGLINALFYLEKYDELFQCALNLPDKNPILTKIAEKFSLIGMCTEAVNIFIKFGDINSAVHICIQQRQWGQAVDLARKFEMPGIGILLSNHASHLIKEGKLSEAVELHKKAERYLDAAHLLSKLAEKEVDRNKNLLHIKKIYVLAGLLTEKHVTYQRKILGVGRDEVFSTLSFEDFNLINRIWHNAEAFHFLLLAQRQIYQNLMSSAITTCLRLCEYEDVLNIIEIYSLLALSSCANKSYDICSKAFIKLESLDVKSVCSQNNYEEIAVNLFSQIELHENTDNTKICFNCNSPVLEYLPSCSQCGINYVPCTASGQSLNGSLQKYWTCLSCYHCAYSEEIKNRETCALCHQLVSNT